MTRSLKNPRTIDPDAIEASRLMERYCSGEAAAFHCLYALVAPRLLSYLGTLVGERASAEGLLQQTFLKLHQARSSYVRNADPLPWLYAIARSTCSDERGALRAILAKR